jgi:AcrR family transcriptional regulator
MMLSMATYHHGDLRSAVLAAAARLVEDEGVAGLSVREAARRAGVSHNAPYRHFPDRESLLSALAANGLAELEQALEGRSGRELGEVYVRFALANPKRFQMMFAMGRGRAMYGRFAQAFVGHPDSHVAAAAAWSLVHGLAQLAIAGHVPQDETFLKKVLGAMRFAQRSA